MGNQICTCDDSKDYDCPNKKRRKHTHQKQYFELSYQSFREVPPPPRLIYEWDKLL